MKPFLNLGQKERAFNCSNCITGRLTADFCQGTCPAFRPLGGMCENYFYLKGDETKALKIASAYFLKFEKRQ